MHGKLKKNKKYKSGGWRVFGVSYKPEDSLYKHLVFALKYEGVNLLVLKKLFQFLGQSKIIQLIQLEPTGQYSRRIWFLYEWLFDKKLALADAYRKIKYVELLDKKRQYAIDNGLRSTRHRIINNLPGTRNFCPLVFRTDKLNNYIKANLSEQQNNYFKHISKNVLQRVSAFLLLKDSKASFSIEGESPKSKRAMHWSKAIGQAGTKPLTKEKLIYLQKTVIVDTRFVDMGFRRKGGFVGEHDRETGMPLPEHISAKCQDLDMLIKGLVVTDQFLEEMDFDAVIAAAMVAFGFVFIHPFQDGNGRIHRYLIHHILARKNFPQQGIIFPISA
ncbi:MAG: Fic family protein [Verrucomicrobiota bacterium]|nr:Fic family protein [Verrucomicrobiota bacterium]